MPRSKLPAGVCTRAAAQQQTGSRGPRVLVHLGERARRQGFEITELEGCGEARVGDRGKGPGRREIRILSCDPAEDLQGPRRALFRCLIGGGEALLIQEPDVDLRRRRPLGPAPFGPIYFRRDRRCDRIGDLVLDGENIVEPAIEPFGPEMIARARIDQLRQNSDAIARLAHAAFEHVAHVQLPRDVVGRHRSALVAEGRASRDDEEPAEIREGVDDVLGHAVGEEGLLGGGRNVVEGQHGDRR